MKEPKEAYISQYFIMALAGICSPSKWKIQAWHKCQLQGRKDSVLVVVFVIHPS